jgi:uncharacterized protein (TIGR00251 family)
VNAWARRVEGGWQLTIHAQPGAKRSEIVGPHGEALKLRVAAPPAEGRANAALEAFLAEALEVPRKSVCVIRGRSARHKLVLVAAPHADPGRLLAACAPPARADARKRG